MHKKNGSKACAWNDKRTSKNFLLSFSACLALAFLSSCGKHETTGSVIGTGAGALIGAAVTKNSGTGALIGGLIGNVFGGVAGRAADEEEREEKREHEARVHARQLATRDHENRILRQQMTKWCVDCNREATIHGANSCTSCGGNLVHEKFCTRCTTLFSPKEGYRYCPYCKTKILLSSR